MLTSNYVSIKDLKKKNTLKINFFVSFENTAHMRSIKYLAFLKKNLTF